MANTPLPEPTQVDTGHLDSAPRDVAWFESIVLAHGPALRAMAHRVAAPQADDLVQETFIRAWSSRMDWDPARGNPRAWLMTLFWTQLSRERRRLGRHVLLPSSTLAAGPTPDIEVAGRIDLEALLRSLPLRQHQAVLLFYLADLTLDDTARLLGISPGSAKTHLSRARTRLAAAMKGHTHAD